MTARAAPLRSVVHVISGLGTGGAETMLARLAVRPGLAARQVVVSLRSGGATRARLEAAGVPVHDLGLDRLPSPAALWRLRAILRRERPEVVQGWMYHGDLLAALAVGLLPRAERPVLCWGVRCSDMDLSRYGRALRLVVRLCARLSGRAEAVIANSQAGRAAHEAIGYHPRRFEVIWNGVDTDAYAFPPETGAAVRAELGLPAGARVFAHVARVDPMKDHAAFLQALDAVPDAHALLIGLDTEALPRHPRALALGRRDDVPRLLTAADAIVSSSAFGEGFPNVLAEGMLSGCLPIATDVGDSAAMIGDSGHVVPRRDPGALAAAMAAVAALPAAALGAARDRARTRARQSFSLDAAEATFRALYHDLLDARARRP